MAGVTIKDIAKALGVNVATVSRALNGQGGVSERVRENVRATAAKLGYQPNALARSLVLSRSNTIGFLVPDFSNPFFVEVAHAVRDKIFPLGYTLIMFDSNWDPELEKSQLRYIEERRVDGLIMKTPNSVRHIGLNPAVPVVLINVIPVETCSSVDTDNFYGGFLAGEALARCGYGRVAYFGSHQDPPASSLRRDGFLTALRHYGVGARQEWLVEGRYSIESGKEMMRAMLALDTPPDAAFCANDLIGLGAMEVLLEQGVRIPEDFGLMGFDDMVMTSLSTIALSTVAQNSAALGQAIADMLLKAMQGGPNRVVERFTIEPRLVLRNTTRKIEPYRPIPAGTARNLAKMA